MYDDVLVGVDGSDGAAAAFDRALALASDHGARLHALYVADTNRDSVTTVSGEVVDTLETEGERALDELVDRSATPTPIVDEVVQGDPVESIVAYADAEGIDLVVLGESGASGVERALLGSTTEGVVRSARTPTLTVSSDPATGEYPFETVLVATDGSDAADAAVDHAGRLAAAHDATLHVLSVVEPSGLDLGPVSEPSDELTAETERLVERTAEAARETGVESVVQTVETGTPHRSIRDYAEDHGADLVAIGGHGRTGFEERLLGGTTEKLLRSIAVPVLTVRPADVQYGDD